MKRPSLIKKLLSQQEYAERRLMSLTDQKSRFD